MKKRILALTLALVMVFALASCAKKEAAGATITVTVVHKDDANQEWWCFTKGGESVNTGVDSTPVADGDAFEITFTVGYDQ